MFSAKTINERECAKVESKRGPAATAALETKRGLSRRAILTPAHGSRMRVADVTFATGGAEGEVGNEPGGSAFSLFLWMGNMPTTPWPRLPFAHPFRRLPDVSLA